MLVSVGGDGAHSTLSVHVPVHAFALFFSPNLPLSDVYHICLHRFATRCKHGVFFLSFNAWCFFILFSSLSFSFFLSSGIRDTSLDLGKDDLELAALLEGNEFVAAANVLLSNKDVGDSALASQLHEVRLNFATVLHVVELDGLEDDVKRGQEALGLGAVRAVGLGEHHDGILSYIN